MDVRLQALAGGLEHTLQTSHSLGAKAHFLFCVCLQMMRRGKTAGHQQNAWHLLPYPSPFPPAESRLMPRHHSLLLTSSAATSTLQSGWRHLALSSSKNFSNLPGAGVWVVQMYIQLQLLLCHLVTTKITTAHQH